MEIPAWPVSRPPAVTDKRRLAGTYINREQDLDEPGLRNNKLFYHPVELVMKFRARRK